MIIIVYKITKPIRLIELFSGYGSQLMALKKICNEFNHEYEMWKTCEWEINAIASYKNIHCSNDINDYSKNLTKEQLIEFLFNKHISNDGKSPMKLMTLQRKTEEWLRNVYNNIYATKNLVDISQVHGSDLEINNVDDYMYIMTYSFPCQSISIAGKGEGFTKNSGTRSGLLWEVERILNECENLPQILLMENVTAIHSKKHIKNFEKWIKKLELLGYYSIWFDMNAKDYGIPHNRNRCFMVSILNGQKNSYKAPEGFELNLCLKDILEDLPLDKYYINNKYVDRMPESSKAIIIDDMYKNRDVRLYDQYSPSLRSERSGLKVVDQVERLTGIFDNDNKHQAGSIYKKEGISPTLDTGCGGWRQPLIIDNKDINTKRIRIRKLTPRECGRLMGVSEQDIAKMESVNSNTQLYKQFGNSIVVDCLYYIFKGFLYE